MGHHIRQIVRGAVAISAQFSELPHPCRPWWPYIGYFSKEDGGSFGANSLNLVAQSVDNLKHTSILHEPCIVWHIAECFSVSLYIYIYIYIYNYINMYIYIYIKIFLSLQCILVPIPGPVPKAWIVSCFVLSRISAVTSTPPQSLPTNTYRQ